MNNEKNNDPMQLIKRASNGSEEAIQMLFYLFQEKKFSQNDLEEIYDYVKQVSQQNPQAIYLHALFYDYGFAVIPNPDMAFLLMREAAAKGHAKAIYEIGRRFLQGIGVEKQEENAFQWLKLAAGSPYYIPEAMYELGRMYEQGLGIEIDLIQAKAWYEKAAEKGSLAAKAKLDF